MTSKLHKKIPLTQGKYALVDICDYEYLSQWKWCYFKHHSGKGGYAVRNSRGLKRRKIYMHRVILRQMGSKDTIQGDHIDQNKLNNLRNNLRPASASQNQHNQSRYKNNTSGYIGVSWCNGKWRAQIQVYGKRKHLGYFDNIKDAARAYNKAALKYHGEFAVLNEV